MLLHCALILKFGIQQKIHAQPMARGEAGEIFKRDENNPTLSAIQFIYVKIIHANTRESLQSKVTYFLPKLLCCIRHLSKHIWITKARSRIYTLETQIYY